MISLARIDERLIHGQVAYSWTMAYKSDAIMVIDDEVSQDQFQKDLLAFACPKDMKCLVVNETRAVELLQKYEGKKIFVVVKHPKVLLNIMKNGVELKSINVGGLYFKEDRKQCTKTVYVDEEMVCIFKELNSLGVELDTRTTPSDESQDLIKLL